MVGILAFKVGLGQGELGWLIVGLDVHGIGGNWYLPESLLLFAQTLLGNTGSSTEHPQVLLHVINILQMQPGNPDPLANESTDHGAIGEMFRAVIIGVRLLLVGVVRLQIFGHVVHGILMLVEMLFQ
jgi:hypothetical protein